MLHHSNTAQSAAVAAGAVSGGLRSFSPSQCHAVAAGASAGSLYAAGGGYNHPALQNHRTQAFAINDLLGKSLLL